MKQPSFAYPLHLSALIGFLHLMLGMDSVHYFIFSENCATYPFVGRTLAHSPISFAYVYTNPLSTGALWCYSAGYTVRFPWIYTKTSDPEAPSAQAIPSHRVFRRSEACTVYGIDLPCRIVKYYVLNHPHLHAALAECPLS